MAVSFSDRLKELRKAQNKTQQDIAEILNCSRYRVIDLERGKVSPTIFDFHLLCRYFDVSSDYMMGRTNVKSTNISVSAICAYLGLNDDSLMALHDNLNGSYNAVSDGLVHRMITGKNAESIDLSEWNDPETDDIEISDLLNLLLASSDFYELLKSICAKRNCLARIASAAATPETKDSIKAENDEADKNAVRCLRIISAYREKLFSDLEGVAELTLEDVEDIEEEENEILIEDEENGNG